MGIHASTSGNRARGSNDWSCRCGGDWERARGCGSGDGGDGVDNGWVGTRDDVEPFQHVVLLSGDVVGDVGGADGLELRAIDVASPSADGGVVLDRGGGLAVSKDVGPLLDALSVIAVAQGGVTKDLVVSLLN